MDKHCWNFKIILTKKQQRDYEAGHLGVMFSIKTKEPEFMSCSFLVLPSSYSSVVKVDSEKKGSSANMSNYWMVFGKIPRFYCLSVFGVSRWKYF